MDLNLIVLYTLQLIRIIIIPPNKLKPIIKDIFSIPDSFLSVLYLKLTEKEERLFAVF